MCANISSIKYFRSIFTQRRTLYTFNENIWLGNIHGMAPNSAYVFRSRPSFNSIYRCLVTDAVNQEVKRGGPFVEYERRIAEGKLATGDASQVDTLKQLQRLYEELVEKSNACRLDQNALLPGNTRMKRWFWSRLGIRQSSYSPVKGLYIYGGVATGKTMLMDLFFDQVWKFWNENKAMDLVDQTLVESCEKSQVCINVGLLCVQEDPDDRPSMSTVVLMLGSESTLPNPTQPAFIVRRRISNMSSSTSTKPDTNSTNELTISIAEGR